LPDESTNAAIIIAAAYCCPRGGMMGYNLVALGSTPNPKPNLVALGSTPKPKPNLVALGSTPNPKPNLVALGSTPNPKPNLVALGGTPKPKPNLVALGTNSGQPLRIHLHRQHIAYITGAGNQLIARQQCWLTLTPKPTGQGWH
jgi:hypothetical protein